MKYVRKTNFALALAAMCISNPLAQAGELLEEVLVTAQKREQNLQDVPVAVTAFSGDQLQDAAVKDIFDLQANVPGLVVNQVTSNSSADFSIRGVGTSASNTGLESSVGLYVDGVYRSRQSAMIGDMVDMESVEVLRGPQGTLFGKNTPSGAVIFRTKAPGHEGDGFVSLSAGNYGLQSVSAAGNLSVIDDVLAIRGTAFSSQQNGFIDVENFGNEIANDRDRWGARLQALIAPTDNLSIRIIGDYSKIDEICCATLTLVDSVQAKYRTAGDGSPIPGSDSLLANLGGTVAIGDQTDTLSTHLNQLPVSTSEDGGLSMEVNWDFSDAYTLTSITGYRVYESFAFTDVDFTDVDLLTTSDDLELSAFSQEIRVSYVDENLNAVVGAYYFDQNIDSVRNLDLGTMFDTFIAQQEGYAPLVDGINEISAAVAPLSGLGGFPNPAFPAAAAAFPTGFSADNFAEQEHRSWAVFGQFEYNLSEALILTMGLRYTNEEKDLRTTFTESVYGNPFIPGLQVSADDLDIAGASLTTLADELGSGDLSGLVDPAIINQFAPYAIAGWGTSLFDGTYAREDVIAELNDEQITGTIKLSGIVSDDSLVYASYGTGYKSGGTNTARIPLGIDPVFDAETSQTYEVGIKSEFPEQAVRLNAAVFYSTVDDFQSDTFSGTSFVLTNAGELESYGVEAEVFWQPTDSATVTLVYAYNIAEYKEHPNGSCWTASPFHTGQPDPNGQDACDRSGDRIPTTPEHLATIGVKKYFDLSDTIEAYLYGEYSYRTELVTGSDNDPLKIQDAYGLLNLRMGVLFERYDVDLILWGRNVLDENYVGVTFDAPLQPGKLEALVGAPRTYGLTLQRSF